MTREVPLDHAAELVRRARDGRAAAGRARAAERELLDLLGDAEVGTIDGHPAVIREVESRPGIDLTSLWRDHPELWDQYPARRERTRLKFPRRPRREAADPPETIP
ncbi:hypothetical protein [Amycolatopsis anabasis]|uniref:hypothetical protein n=1 Tax=Amycolatopsis anabasis TaxID=1840409 RepID=UPI00131CF825|nr:hypothetical protein [Amycolatopsis anabasis]